ncbi:MAG: hypothetical protein A2046_11495 [Bacteroidetes bacterium GWA2_30_7]|nr:MAG: hypothetical protein A2046_11495 [Bacteroidetes bacterium GWA2_30_7]
MSLSKCQCVQNTNNQTVSDIEYQIIEIYLLFGFSNLCFDLEYKELFCIDKSYIFRKIKMRIKILLLLNKFKVISGKLFEVNKLSKFT